MFMAMDVELREALNDADGGGSSLLLAAFVGCFLEIEDDRGDANASANDEENDMGSSANANVGDRRCVLHGVRRALLYLTRDDDAPGAKKELERVVCAVCERRMPSKWRHSAPEHRDHHVLQLLRDLAGISSGHGRSAPVVLPVTLLYVVYYLACSRSAPGVWWHGLGCSRWAYLFFNQLLSRIVVPPLVSQASTTATTEVADARSSGTGTGTLPPSPRAGDVSSPAPVIQLDHLRSCIAQIFLENSAHQGATRVFTFIDAYRAWLMRDYHSVLENTRRILCAMPWREDRCIMLWLMRHASRFMYAISVVATTNTAHPTSRRDIRERIRRASEEYSDSDYDDDDDDDDDDYGGDGGRLLVGVSLPSRPSLLRHVNELLRSEVFNDDDDDDDGEEGKGEKNVVVMMEGGGGGCGCGACVGPLDSVKWWRGMFLSTIRVWLRAKRLTDSGKMTASRDLLICTVDGPRGDCSVAPFANTLGHHFGVPGGACGRRGVFVWLMPIFWLRQLLMVNCAALADTVTVLSLIQHWRERQQQQNPLTLAEALYLAACPTLAAGGVHIPILASFPAGGVEAARTAPGFVESLERLPLPVQVPLLAHRFWQLRQHLLHDLPRRTGEDNVSYRGCRFSLQCEVLELCEALVTRVQGLFGTLELSFTDCAPGRIMFDAITVACDVQEDVLRCRAASLNGAPPLLPPDSSRSSSSSSSSTTITITGRSNETVMPVRLLESSTGMHLRVRSGLSHGNASPEVLAPRRSITSRVTSVRDDDDGDYYHYYGGSTDYDGNVDDGGDGGLAAKSPTSLGPSSGASTFAMVASATPTTAQELYWFACRKVVQWMDLLERNYPHLRLIVDVCRLRMTAASFDVTVVQLARKLLEDFRNNALAGAHISIALFASLHIVQAERCIRETLQQFPHSAEVQRLYRIICHHDCNSERDVREGGGEQQRERNGVRQAVGPVYIHRYRGVLPLRYAISHRVAVVSYLPLVVCLLSVALLGLSLVLHVRAASFADDVYIWNTSWEGDGKSSDSTRSGGGDSATDVLHFPWSFVLPCPLLMYLGFGVVAHALIAAVVVPLVAQRGVGSPDDGDESSRGKRSLMISRFLSALMATDSLVNDRPNRLIFCLRGVPLVNLLTGGQIVANNAIRLKVASEQICGGISAAPLATATEAASERDAACGRLSVEWAMISLFLIVFLLVMGVVFHGHAWQVVRGCDVIVGSLATFITIFLLDTALFITSFPLLFLCSVVLEPLLFILTAVFGAAASVPLLVEHLPSVPGDDLLVPPFSSAGARRLDSVDVFRTHLTSQLHERLLSSLPPPRWSPSRLHDFPFLCSHEVFQPTNGTSDADRPTRSGAVLHLVRELASRGIAGCIALHRVIRWRACRSPQESEAAVRLALVRENCAASVFPSPSSSSSPSPSPPPPIASTAWRHGASIIPGAGVREGIADRLTSASPSKVLPTTSYG